MNIFCKWQFHNASKEVLWPKIFSNFFLGQKTFFEALQKCHLLQIFITFSWVRQIQDLDQSKYKLRLFSKRTHRILTILFYLGFLRIPSKPGKQNWKLPFFWVFIIVKKPSMFPMHNGCLIYKPGSVSHLIGL